MSLVSDRSVLSGTAISLSDQGFIESFLEAFPCEASEYSFANLYVWRKSRKIHWFEEKEHLYFYYEDGDSLFFMQPVGPCPTDAISYGLKNFPRAKWVRIHSKFTHDLNCAGSFVVQDDPANYDYIYRRLDLVQRKGSQYQGMRNTIRQFEARCSGKLRIEPISKTNMSSCRIVASNWRDQKNSVDCNKDYIACLELLNLFDEFKAHGILIYIEDRPVAIQIGLIGVASFVLHFAKSDLLIPGLSTVSFCSQFQSLTEEVEIVNLMQDCGNSGLRTWKSSLRPFGYVQKSEIIPV